MGKGDKKSKRGKIVRGSYGVRRRQRVRRAQFPEAGDKNTTPETKIKADEARVIKSEKPKPAHKPSSKPAARASRSATKGEA